MVPKVVVLYRFSHHQLQYLLPAGPTRQQVLQLMMTRLYRFDCSLFHVQMQKPTSRSTTTRAFVSQNLLNFIIAKYLKQVDDDLSIYVDECSPCGLSITGDIKIYQCHVIKR